MVRPSDEDKTASDVSCRSSLNSVLSGHTLSLHCSVNVKVHELMSAIDGKAQFVACLSASVRSSSFCWAVPHRMCGMRQEQTSTYQHWADEQHGWWQCSSVFQCRSTGIS